MEKINKILVLLCLDGFSFWSSFLLKRKLQFLLSNQDPKHWAKLNYTNKANWPKNQIEIKFFRVRDLTFFFHLVLIT